MDPVPRISEFYGIAIYMYFSDHPPPHIHAQYGGVEAVIAIGDGAVIRGSIPDRALRSPVRARGKLLQQLRISVEPVQPYATR